MDQRAEEAAFGVGGDDAFKDDNVSLLDEGSVGQYIDHGSPLRRGGPQGTGARPGTAGSVLDRGSPKMPGMVDTGSLVSGMSKSKNSRVSSAGEQNELDGLVHGVRTHAPLTPYLPSQTTREHPEQGFRCWIVKVRLRAAADAPIGQFDRRQHHGLAPAHVGVPASPSAIRPWGALLELTPQCLRLGQQHQHACRYARLL